MALQISEIVLVATTIGAIATAIAAIISNRRKPQLDAAQAEKVLGDSDAVKAEIKRQSEASNARRDLRLLDLENWAFEKVRPWGRDVVQKFDVICDLMREDRRALHLDMPDVRLEPFPEMPPPRPSLGSGP